MSYQQYVPVASYGGSPQPHPMYVSASPQHNVIQLPGSVQYLPAPGHSPGQVVQQLPGGQVYLQTQPMGYMPHTPIMPVHNALPTVHYNQANPEPKVHYGLAASPNPLVFWDVFQPTSTLTALDASYPIQPSLSAVEPAVPTMRLVCKDMPWIITIKKSVGYVTIGDVYEAIYTQLQEPIIHSEWRLMGLSSQKKVTQRFRYRNELLRSMGKEEDTRGIRRVDYLLNKTAFVGLKQDDKAVKDLVGDIDIHNAWILVVGERK